MSLCGFNRRRRELAAQKAQDAQAAPGKPLDKMNKAELLALAEARGVEAKESMTKADILEVLGAKGAE